MTFTRKQVQRGRELVANLNKSKWQLGDLALEVMAPSYDRAVGLTEGPQVEELRRFATAISLTWDRLKKYRTVSVTFPPEVRRQDLSWTVHEEMLSAPDPHALLAEDVAWTTDLVRERLNRAPAGSRNRRAMSEHEEITLAQEVMADPRRAVHVMRDLNARSEASRAAVQVRNEEFEATKADFELSHPEETKTWAEQDVEISKTGHALEAHALIYHARRDLIAASEQWAKALGGTGQASTVFAGFDAWRHLDAVDRRCLEEIVTLAQALGGSTGVSLDEALAEILSESR